MHTILENLGEELEIKKKKKKKKQKENLQV